ncbi:MAG: tetratricopeptide repeat protein [Rhodobacteraceae bacterium]|nr:tetratricopeptide repeat protein [Paracoccaceae bacterium]
MLNAISDVPAAVSSGKDWDVGNGPTRTSLAVMPIRVLGESMRGAELAVGLETEIVTTLAKLSDLAIIDLSTLGGQQDGETQGGPADHGAEAVLKCDLQVVGDKLRVTARLIDTTTARQIWADRFDRGLSDILEIQDALTKDIVTQLQVRLTEGEQARVWSSGTGDFNAWEAIVRATHLIHAHQKEGIREARHLAEGAVQRDPSFASAYAAIGWTHWVEGRWFWSDDRASSFDKALDLAQRALALDAVNPDARTLHGVVLVHVGRFDPALEEMERAVSLAPSHAHIAALAAYCLTSALVGQI